MRVLIVGVGRAGLNIAQHLSQSGHEVTVIDRDRAITTRASEQYGLITLSGDATDASVLEDAEIRRADVVVALLQRDADNLAVALLARSAGVERVMARLRDKAYASVYLEARLTIIIRETPIVSQPGAPFGRGTTVVTPHSEVTASEDKPTPPLTYIEGAASLADVTNALSTLGVGPRELASILQALRSAGALRAEIVMQ